MSIVKRRYNTRHKALALELLRKMSRERINPNLATDTMLDVDLTIPEKNTQMHILHSKEMQQNTKQLRNLLPSHFSDHCYVISIDMYIPLPIPQLNKVEQIRRHTEKFQLEMQKLPSLRPLFVQCSYRIPPPYSASHSWALVIDHQNVMYAYDPSSENKFHSTSIVIRSIPGLEICSYDFNRKIDNSCGLYGACHWGSFALLLLSALCYDNNIKQIDLCHQVAYLNDDFLEFLLEFVDTHLRKRATSTNAKLLTESFLSALAQI